MPKTKNPFLTLKEGIKSKTSFLFNAKKAEAIAINKFNDDVINAVTFAQANKLASDSKTPYEGGNIDKKQKGCQFYQPC